MAKTGKTAPDSGFTFKNTKDLKVPPVLIEQIIGQDSAVNVIRKAAKQRRHVLLIGDPGTGKSMMGMAMAELLPREKLVDILVFANPNDENQPLVRVVPAGKGREVVSSSRLEAGRMFRHQNVVMLILLIASLILPWWAFNHYSEQNAILGGIMFLAFSLVGLASLVSFILFLNLGRRLEGKVRSPKAIVDNFSRKIAPFFDATGAHAGALLGDVLHDPFQSLRSSDKIAIVQEGGNIKYVAAGELIDAYMAENPSKLLRNSENDYEAVHLPKASLFVLGETGGTATKAEVLSFNRYDYNGELIKIKITSNKEIAVTPGHKVAIKTRTGISYVEAQAVKPGDQILSTKNGLVLDEEDIIGTYDAHQEEQCRLYYQYLSIKSANPAWGYKRIAKAMGQSIGKTRWWHAKKHMPVPIQTAAWLKAKGLLPLKTDNPKLPLIAKVLGATFGDGGVFENLNGIFLSSSEKEAVEEFEKDIETIFDLQADSNSRIIEGGVYGHSWCYQHTNRKVIRFFLALGAPKGNKTKQELRIPSWITINSNLEDEFYGSLFGGEMGTPIMHKVGNHLTNLELGITGSEKFDVNRKEFLSKVASYLFRKNVICTSLYAREYTRKLKNNSVIYRLQLGKKFDNVLSFMVNVKINYCNYKKERLLKALGQWTSLKKSKYYDLIDRGYGAESAMRLLNLTPQTLYLILNHFGPKHGVVA